MITLFPASEAYGKTKKAPRRHEKANKKAQTEDETRSLEHTFIHSKDDAQEVLGKDEQKIEMASSELESNEDTSNADKFEAIISEETSRRFEIILGTSE